MGGKGRRAGCGGQLTLPPSPPASPPGLGQLTPFTPYTVKVSMRPGVEGALHCTALRLQAAPCTQGGLGEQGGGGGWQGRCAVQADGGQEGATQCGARTCHRHLIVAAVRAAVRGHYLRVSPTTCKPVVNITDHHHCGRHTVTKKFKTILPILLVKPKLWKVYIFISNTFSMLKFTFFCQQVGKCSQPSLKVVNSRKNSLKKLDTLFAKW